LAEEKSFLQTIKLEISRSFKLVPYERLAFHKVLGILKSDVGMSILIKELERGPDIRHSAISILVNFDHPDVLSALVSQLRNNITDRECIMIFEHVRRRGGTENIKDIITFIENYLGHQGSRAIITMAFDVLKIIGIESDEVLNFLMTKISAKRLDPQIRSLVIESLSSFKSISVFEKIYYQGNCALISTSA